MVNQAIKEYLQTNTWPIDKITQGIAATDRGEVIAHDDVMREMKDLIESKASGESLFLRKILWASLPNKRQKLRDIFTYMTSLPVADLCIC